MIPLPIHPEIIAQFAPPDPPFIRVYWENVGPCLAGLAPLGIGLYLLAKLYNSRAKDYEMDDAFQAEQAALYVESHQNRGSRIKGFLGEAVGSALLGTAVSFVLTHGSQEVGGPTILPPETGVPVTIGAAAVILVLVLMSGGLPNNNKYKQAAENVVRNYRE